MEIIADTLILLIVLQTALRLSQWNGWLQLTYCFVVGAALWLSVSFAAELTKPQVEAWLHNTAILQNVAVFCILDALLCLPSSLFPPSSLHFPPSSFHFPPSSFHFPPSSLLQYPGLLILPASFYVLCQMLFTMAGASFQTTGLLLAAILSTTLLLLSNVSARLLPQKTDRSILHTIITILICLTSLIATQQAVTVYPAINQNIIMDYISRTLFGIANILLIPDVIMLILFFIRSLILLATTSMQYADRRRDGYGRLYTKYRDLLYGQEPSEAYADYLAAQMEAEAAKDVNLSRLLTKLGPVLGLIGTLISMSPALVGLSTGDISGMAYNMQVVFSATVVGLVISVVGLFTQQLKSRWHQQDISRLEYVSSLYIEKHEKEA